MAGEQLLSIIRPLAESVFGRQTFEPALVIAFGVAILLAFYWMWFGSRQLLADRSPSSRKKETVDLVWQELTHSQSKQIAISKTGNTREVSMRVNPRKLRSSLWYQVKLFAKLNNLILRPNPVKLGLATLFGATYLVLFAIYFFYTRPYVIYQWPDAATAWVNFRDPLVIYFDKPVNKDLLKLNIAPEIPGRMEWIPSFSRLTDNVQFYRSFKFYPEQTILPDQELVVYLVGIQNLTGVDGLHESNVALQAPKTPEVLGANIVDKQIDVVAASDIEFNLSVPSGEYVDWDLEIEPEVGFTIGQPAPDKLVIHFDKALEQNTKYSVKLIRTLIEVKLSTQEVLSRLDAKTVSTFSFTTVKTPGIKKITPKGTSALPADKLTLEFDLPMDRASLEQAWSITPAILGSFTWLSDTQLEYIPAAELPKDSKFQLKILPTAKSLAGGMLKELIHDFKTVGAVEVTTFSPKNGLTDVSILDTIKVRFDQPVDKKSAQSKFEINPGVSGGKFSWSGNEMRYKHNGLAYGRDYTVKIKEGVKTIHGFDSTKSFSASFRTANEQFILGVTQYSQQERFTCNVAATRMALSYKGVYKSEGEIKSGMGIGQSLSGGSGGDPYSDWINGYGTYWTTASSYISRYRSNSIKRNWNVGDMLREVRKGNPVILWWQNGWGSWYWKSWTVPGGGTVSGLNGMHSEVVIGYRGPINSPHTIITRDPWRGTRYYSYGYFDNLWKNSFGRTAVVVY